MRIQYVVPALLMLGACANDVSEEGAPGASDVVAMEACPVRLVGEWEAWVDAEPPGPRTLHISGQAEAPTPGYEVSWRVGFADRAMPPGQHMYLDVTPPDGMVAQVITPMKLNYEGEAVYPEYRAAIVHCGEDQVIEITPVPVAY